MINGISIGEKVIVTCDGWFFGSDGNSYKAAWGTLHAVLSDSETLGIKTNSRSTNWYVKVGNLLIAGCQIHYAMVCPERPNTEPVKDDDGKQILSRIWDADQ